MRIAHRFALLLLLGCGGTAPLPPPVPELAPPRGASLPATAVPGWLGRATAGDRYRFVLDSTAPHGGLQCLSILSTGASADDALCLAQSSHWPADARAAAIRLSAWIRGRGLSGEVRLWLGDDERLVAALVPADESWTEHHLDLRTPSTGRLRYGLVLRGEGQVWIDDLSLVAVDAVEHPAPDWRLPIEPRLDPLPEALNLDFEILADGDH